MQILFYSCYISSLALAGNTRRSIQVVKNENAPLFPPPNLLALLLYPVCSEDTQNTDPCKRYRSSVCYPEFGSKDHIKRKQQQPKQTQIDQQNNKDISQQTIIHANQQ